MNLLLGLCMLCDREKMDSNSEFKCNTGIKFESDGEEFVVGFDVAKQGGEGVEGCPQPFVGGVEGVCLKVGVVVVDAVFTCVVVWWCVGGKSRAGSSAKNGLLGKRGDSKLFSSFLW